MTSFAFVMGVLPMARATGAGAYSRNSLGIVIAFGIAVSTVLGRFVIPIYYVLGRTDPRRVGPSRVPRPRTHRLARIVARVVTPPRRDHRRKTGGQLGPRSAVHPGPLDPLDRSESRIASCSMIRGAIPGPGATI